MEHVVVFFVLILCLGKITLPFLSKCDLSSVCPRSRPLSSSSHILSFLFYPWILYSTDFLSLTSLTCCHRLAELLLSSRCLLHGLHGLEGQYMAPTWWNVLIVPVSPVYWLTWWQTEQLHSSILQREIDKMKITFQIWLLEDGKNPFPLVFQSIDSKSFTL